jgi:WD40 repeat protein
LASGASNDYIKLWNVKEQACIHTFDFHPGPIRSLFFAGDADIVCLAATRAMPLIRLWREEGSSDFASEIIGEADQVVNVPLGAEFTSCGSFLANSFGTVLGNESTVELYELETMTKTQSVVVPDFAAYCFAFSPDSKRLVIGGKLDTGGHVRGRIRLLQTDDLRIQRDLEVSASMLPVWSVAFDPSCRFLAFGCQDGRLELRSL